MAIPESLRLVLETPIFETAALLLGLIVGSFANVLIHRLPRGESVVTPPSRCPACGALVRPFDNVPVLSYLLLLGRCRSCRARISPRYPAVEAANGLAYFLLAVQRGPAFSTLVAMALVTALLVLSLIDLDHQILPDAITLPGLAAGLVTGPLVSGAPGTDALTVLGGLSAVAWIGMLTGWDKRPDGDAPTGTMRADWRMLAMLAAFVLWQWVVAGTLSEPALAAGLGYLALFGVAWAYKRFRGVEGLGEGDWKMVAMLGAFLGWQKMLLTVFLASLTGTAVGLVLVAALGGTFKSKLPLGTFLGGAGIVVVLAGDPILAWYRRLLGA